MNTANQSLASIPKRFIALLIDVILIWAILIGVLVAYDVFILEMSWKNSSILNLGKITIEWFNTKDWLYGQAVTRYPLTYLNHYGLFGVLVPLLFFWIYYGLLEGSGLNASLGKMIMGIKVSNDDGSKLNFSKASMRYIGKVISTVIVFIGYIMAFFNPERKTLHDNIARTRVINR